MNTDNIKFFNGGIENIKRHLTNHDYSLVVICCIDIIDRIETIQPTITLYELTLDWLRKNNDSFVSLLEKLNESIKMLEEYYINDTNIELPLICLLTIITHIKERVSK